mmetsp:Transcript_16609/g.41511  ORF Transcript_16609/g.41511 Transcript_16609/m.41511 type:complete len:89 (-) Transcript_16609:2529-2795(-)
MPGVNNVSRACDHQQSKAQGAMQIVHAPGRQAGRRAGRQAGRQWQARPLHVGASTEAAATWYIAQCLTSISKAVAAHLGYVVDTASYI